MPLPLTTAVAEGVGFRVPGSNAHGTDARQVTVSNDRTTATIEASDPDICATNHVTTSYPSLDASTRMVADLADPAGPARINRDWPWPYRASRPSRAAVSSARGDRGGGVGRPNAVSHALISPSLARCMHRSSSECGAYLSIHSTDGTEDGRPESASDEAERAGRAEGGVDVMVWSVKASLPDAAAEEDEAANFRRLARSTAACSTAPRSTMATSDSSSPPCHCDCDCCDCV